jgi:flagellar biosynthesis protein FlhG
MIDHQDTGGPSVYAVASGKGGVGKSVLSVLLAAELARPGRRVLLLDGAAGEGDLHVLLALRRSTEEEIWLETGRESTPLPVAERLWVLTGDSFSSAASRSDPRERARAHLRTTALFDDYEDVVVDAGPGLEAALRSTMRCSRLLAVAVPEPASLYSAYALIKAVDAQAPGLPIDLLVNRAVDTEEGTRAFEILDYACRRYLDRRLTHRGTMLEQREVRRAVQAPGRLPALEFEEIARLAASLRQAQAAERSETHPLGGEVICPH